MRAALLVIGLILTVALGAAIVKTGNFWSDAVVVAQTRNGPKFRIVGGSFSGSHASYSLQTPPEEKNYAEDCIGCELEVGNSVIFAEFGCLNVSEYLFESNSENDVVQKEPIFDSDGKETGQRHISLLKDDEGKILAARMYWIDGVDFWAVQAPTVELTKALRESAQYDEIRKTVAEEIKNYVPIQNANTIGKDPCERGNIQRRVSH